MICKVIDTYIVNIILNIVNRMVYPLSNRLVEEKEQPFDQYLLCWNSCTCSSHHHVVIIIICCCCFVCLDKRGNLQRKLERRIYIISL